MFEKVNPSHPDKAADRIAGAIVDYAYAKEDSPKIAVEVLIGHNTCQIIIESSVWVPTTFIQSAVDRIVGEGVEVRYRYVQQDAILAANQQVLRCGDNGIFKGAPITEEQERLSSFVRSLYLDYPTDGKFIIDGDRLIACQSYMEDDGLDGRCGDFSEVTLNPLGYWTGGINVDSGATNRKLGSDMGDGITGGGLHGKDLSKADVSVNIWAHLWAQKLGREVKCLCAIGDTAVMVDGEPVLFSEMVETAREYIESVGGFEKFAEWGLV